MWIDFAFSFYITVNKVLKIASSIVCITASSTLMIWLLFPQGHLAIFLVHLGNYWLGFFIEFIVCLLISDVILFLIAVIAKKRRHELSTGFHKVYGVVVFMAALLLTVGGCINARKIQVNRYDISIEKKQAAVDQLKVVLLADFHMGYSVGYEQIKQMVEKTNAEHPDLILIAGDIFDNNYDAISEPKRISEILKQLNARYGVYATFGNHDVKAKLVGGFTIGGTKLRDSRMEQFLKNSNINVLLDDTVSIVEDSIYLIGRLDGEETGIAQPRKSIKQLTAGLNSEKPVFVINHEPVQLEKYARNQVDVLFSGHTHDGQFFPLTVINPFVWPNSHGCVKKGEMYSLVTSGVGVYGPYMRTFTEAEVMTINIHMQ